jgi:hypothetical protein
MHFGAKTILGQNSFLKEILSNKTVLIRPFPTKTPFEQNPFRTKLFSNKTLFKQNSFWTKLLSNKTPFQTKTPFRTKLPFEQKSPVQHNFHKLGSSALSSAFSHSRQSAETSFVRQCGRNKNFLNKGNTRPRNSAAEKIRFHFFISSSTVDHQTLVFLIWSIYFSQSLAMTIHIEYWQQQHCNA